VGILSHRAVNFSALVSVSVSRLLTLANSTRIILCSIDIVTADV